MHRIICDFENIEEFTRFIYRKKLSNSMKLEDTKFVAEAKSVRELNLYLNSGWVLILSYIKQYSDGQEPRFVVAWQKESEPIIPEMLDSWELKEINRQR